MGVLYCRNLNSKSQIQWHAETGMLYAVQQGKTWVLLTGKIVDSDLIKPQQNLTALLKQNARFIQEQQGQWLSTGAVILRIIHNNKLNMKARSWVG